MTRFSIIVPVYKVEKFIKQCMQSILNQTFKDFEVICVDDCGKDNSVKIIEKMAERDDRITILHHEKNRGLSAARNTGFEIAKGEYTLFVDSDDWLELNCLETINKYIDKNKDINSVFFDAHRYSDEKHKVVKDSILKNTSGRTVLSPPDMASGCDYAWIKAYKTSAIRDRNLKFPEGLTFEDGEFYFKFFSLYPETLIIQECLYFYRVREGSIVTNAHKGNIKLDHIYQVVRNIREFYIKENLYEKYKIALAILLTNRINTCKNVRFHYMKSILMSNQIIEDFGTIDEFKEFEQNQFPLMSIIVSLNDNTENTIKCIKDIQNQNYINFEIICVHNGLNKDTEDFLNLAKENDKRIRIIGNKDGDSYLAGIANAKGQYVIFVNSNDTIRQGYISKAAEVLFENKTNIAIFENPAEYHDIKSGRFVVEDSSVFYMPIDFHSYVCSRDFIIKNNLLNENSIQELCFKVLINSKHAYYESTNYYIKNKEYINENADLFSNMQSLLHYMKENNLYDKYIKSCMKILSASIRIGDKSQTINKDTLKTLKDYIKN